MDHRQTSVRSELRDTLRLAWPIVVGYVGHMSMGLVDTFVAGRIGTDALAGLGLGANFFWTFTHVCIGCLLALDTFFAQSIGAKDDKALSRYLRQSFWLCGLVTLAATVMVLGSYALYDGLARDSAAKTAFVTYTVNVVWCVPSLCAFFLLQRYWQARHCVWPFTFIIIAANLLNLWLNLALGFGWWGFPRLEVKGLALASVAGRYVMLAAAILYTWRRMRPVTWKLPRIEWPVQREFLGLGLPATGHTALEIGAFGIATFLASLLGAVPMAAHHICLMMAAFTFMVPAGLSAAASVRVGVFVGAAEPARARRAGWLCIGLAVAVMGTFALGYLLFPRLLLGAFTADAAVVEMGLKILLLVALFQIADGIQVTAAGALRGIGNTRAAMIANLIGHYPIGLLPGVVLCFGLGWGVVGLWIGLALGLISVASMLLRAWSWKTRDLATLRPLASVPEPAVR